MKVAIALLIALVGLNAEAQRSNSRTGVSTSQTQTNAAATARQSVRLNSLNQFNDTNSVSMRRLRSSFAQTLQIDGVEKKVRQVYNNEKAGTRAFVATEGEAQVFIEVTGSAKLSGRQMWNMARGRIYAVSHYGNEGYPDSLFENWVISKSVRDEATGTQKLFITFSLLEVTNPHPQAISDDEAFDLMKENVRKRLVKNFGYGL